MELETSANLANWSENCASWNKKNEKAAPKLSIVKQNIVDTFTRLSKTVFNFVNVSTIFCPVLLGNIYVNIHNAYMYI